MNSIGFLLIFAIAAAVVVLALKVGRLQRQVDQAERSIRQLAAGLKPKGSRSLAGDLMEKIVRPAESAPAMSSGQTPSLPPVIGPSLVPASLARDRASEPTDPAVETEPPQPSAPPLSPGTAGRHAPAGFAWGSVEWEKFMGARLFAWLGGLALFLGVAYFVKYSFDRNLITPSGRVGIGLITGMGLLAGGMRIRQGRYATTAQTLCATGILILYASVFAGNAFYRLSWLPLAFTFLLMVAITAIAFILAVRINARAIAVLGLLGGFLTPILLSTGEDQPAVLFSYIFLLNLGLLALVAYRRWNFLAVLAAAGTVLMEFGWAMQFFSANRAGLAWFIFAIFNGQFVAAYLAARRREPGNDWPAKSVVVIASATLAFGGWLLADSGVGARPGLVFSLVLVADLALLVVAWFRERPDLAHIVAGVVTFGFLTVWQSLHLTAATLGWALGWTLVFACLHAGFPMVLRHFKPASQPAGFPQIFPLLGLAVLIIPGFQLQEISFAIWPTILLLDLVALGLAVWIRGPLTALGALVLTGLTTALWISKLSNVPDGDLGVGLGVVIVTTVLFSAASGLIRGFDFSGPGAPDVTGGNAGKADPRTSWSGWVLPSAAALMPFQLLAQMVGHLDGPNPSAIFGAAMVIVMLLMALSYFLRAGFLPLLALAGLSLVQEVWLVDELYRSTHPALILAWCGIFILLFALFPFLLRRRMEGAILPWAAAALSGLPAFHLTYSVTEKFWANNFMGIIPLLFAIPPGLILGWLVRHENRSTRTGQARLAWLGGATLFFLTLALPIQFRQQWLTLGLALEGAALVGLWKRVPHPGLKWVGVGLLLAVFLRLTANPFVLEYHVRGSWPLLNTWLGLYGPAALAFFIAAAWLPPTADRLGPVRARPLLTTLGVILVFGLVNLEIADYFTPVGEPVRFEFTGHFARDMTYTIAWALFAVGLIGVGMTRRLSSARWSGLGLLTVTLAKLFLTDLARLDQLYRVGALLGVATAAIAASLLYQRFLSREMNWRTKH